VARRCRFTSWVVFLAVIPVVAIAEAGGARLAPVRPGALGQSRAQDAVSAPATGAVSPPVAQVIAPPLATGPAPDLDLVFTDQVIGYIEPCG